jgi:hypothetical protein
VKHSPTPWHLVGHNWSDKSIYDADKKLICTSSIEGEATEETQEELERIQDEQIRHIIRCVNNHEALVKALEDALVLLESQETQIDGEWGDCRGLEQIEKDGDLSREIIQAREALANAKTKQ